MKMIGSRLLILGLIYHAATAVEALKIGNRPPLRERMQSLPPPVQRSRDQNTHSSWGKHTTTTEDLTVTLRGGQVDTGTAATAATSAVSQWMRIHRWIALTVGLALLLIPRQMDLGLLYPRPLTHSEANYLRSWGIFAIWIAYVAHQSSFLESSAPDFQLVIAKGLVGMFLGMVSLHSWDFFLGDKDERKLNMAYVVFFSTLATGYLVAMSK